MESLLADTIEKPLFPDSGRLNCPLTPNRVTKHHNKEASTFCKHCIRALISMLIKRRITIHLKYAKSAQPFKQVKKYSNSVTIKSYICRFK